jgi:hypothetical protein
MTLLDPISPARRLSLPYAYTTMTGLPINESLLRTLIGVAPDIGSYEAQGAELRTLRPLSVDVCDLLRLRPMHHAGELFDITEPLPPALDALPQGTRYLGLFNEGSQHVAHVVALRDGSVWSWKLALGAWRVMAPSHKVRKLMRSSR